MAKQTLDDLLAQQSNRRPQSAPLASVARPQVNEKTNEKIVKAIGDELLTRWEDVEILDDNPFQPRAFITSEELEDLKADINNNGQVQAGIARPHPTKAGRFQLAVAHRRKRAVQEGANAGTGRKDAHQYIGKLRVEIRDLSDEQMLDYAYAENAVRQNLNAFDNARYYKELQAQMSKAEGKPLSFEQMVASRAEQKRPLLLTARSIYRVVKVLDLPQVIQDSLAQINLAKKDEEKPRRPGEKHCRALLALQPSEQTDPSIKPNALQLKVLREIEEERLSGDATLARVAELLAPPDEAAPVAATQNQNSATKLSPGTTQNKSSGAARSSSSNTTSAGSSTLGNSTYTTTDTSSNQTQSSQSPADLIESDLREVNSRLGRAATTLEGGTASATLRRVISREMELIEQNLARIKNSAL